MRKFRYQKKIKYVLFMTMGAIFMCSCTSSIDYTQKQEDMIANYAAEMVLKHDINYKYNYIDSVSNVKDSNEDIEDTGFNEETTNQQPNNSLNENISGITDVGDYELSDVSAITKAFELPAGITASFVDYDVTDIYPKDSSSASFVMKAIENSKLLVLKFKIVNSTDSDIDVNFMANEKKYRGIVNSAKKYNAQLTLLADALNTYEGKIPAKSEKELVIIYQTQIDTKEDVRELSVSVYNNQGNENTIYLK